MDDQAASSSLEEELFEQAWAEFRSPRPTKLTASLLGALALVFVAGLFMNLHSVTNVLLLMAAVAFHEAGHAIGMRAFGYADVQMFFIPFFGAAVVGRDRGAAAWKEAAVALLGPLPGLILGLLLLLISARQAYPIALPFQAAAALLWLNAFNLLPLGFLDGGRFLERILLSRHRVLEVAGLTIGYVLLGILALKSAMYLLGIFCVLGLIALPLRWRTLTEAARLRKVLPLLDPDPGRIGELEARELFSGARTVLQHRGWQAPAIAREMESILRATTRKPPGALATTGLLAGYGLGLGCGIIGILWSSLFVGPVEWQPVKEGGWRAEFPRPPLHLQADLLGPQSIRWSTSVNGAERFTIEAAPGGDDGSWMNSGADELAKLTKMSLRSVRGVSVGGLPGREFEFSTHGRIMRARMVTSSTQRYVASASAPTWGESQRRFIESFTLEDSLPQP